MGEQFALFFTEVIAPVIQTIVIIAIGFAAEAARRRWNISFFNDNIESIESLALKAVRYAEEEGEAYFKRTGEKIDSDSKYGWAAEWLMKQAPKLEIDQIRPWIKEALNLAGLGASAKKEGSVEK